MERNATVGKKKKPFGDENRISRKSDEIEKEWDKYRKERQKMKLPYKNIEEWLIEKKKIKKAEKATPNPWPADQDPIVVFSQAQLHELTVGIFDQQKGENPSDSEVRATIAISHNRFPVLLRPLNDEAAQALIDALKEWIGEK